MDIMTTLEQLPPVQLQEIAAEYAPENPWALTEGAELVEQAPALRKAVARYVENDRRWKVEHAEAEARTRFREALVRATKPGAAQEWEPRTADELGRPETPADILPPEELS